MQNLTVITGTFDLVHLGHMKFISEAKKINPENKLLIIILSDENIRERKGPTRPLFNQDSRKEFLEYHKDVDNVLIWEDHWEKLRDYIQDIQPSILAVNEGDPGIDNKRSIVESYGGALHVFKRYKDLATTKIINQIQDLKDAHN